RGPAGWELPGAGPPASPSAWHSALHAAVKVPPTVWSDRTVSSRSSLRQPVAANRTARAALAARARRATRFVRPSMASSLSGDAERPGRFVEIAAVGDRAGRRLAVGVPSVVGATPERRPNAGSRWTELGRAHV